MTSTCKSTLRGFEVPWKPGPHPNFVIIARTDARQAKPLGGSEAGEKAFHEGAKRLKLALDAGADMAFMESPRTEDECKELKACAPKPVLINVTPIVTPLRSAAFIEAFHSSRASSLPRHG
jgi:2-methylisocitrate lyase-like PEP mutase family enzyme